MDKLTRPHIILPIELPGFWEVMNNPDSKPLEFEGFRKQAGLNSFMPTSAIGIISKSGRYGGIIAHKESINYGKE